MSDKFEALKASASGIARLLGDIASFDSWDIDGDIVDIRFEDENGCDTGADVSITETADKASQAIGELLAALEEKDQRIAELEGDVRFERLRLNEAEIAALIKRADAAEQREEHLKATVDVLSAKNAELERANAAQDDHINQQQDRIGTLEKKNGELGKHVGKLEKLLKGTEESLIASVDNVAELEQRLQQPIKLPKREIGMACEFVSDHIVVSLAAVLVEAVAAGFKAEVEGK